MHLQCRTLHNPAQHMHNPCTELPFICTSNTPSSGISLHLPAYSLHGQAPWRADHLYPIFQRSGTCPCPALQISSFFSLSLQNLG